MQQRSEETRARILAEASRLFAQNGYDATGVAEICRAAGVSKGAFYHHFPSKHDVFMRLLTDWLATLESHLLELTGGENAPRDLVQLAPLIREVFTSGQGQLAMFLEFWLQAARDPVIWETTIAPYHHFERLFARFFEQGMRSGALRDIPAGHASRIILALALGLIVQGLFDPDSANWEIITQQGLQIFMDGMARR